MKRHAFMATLQTRRDPSFLKNFTNPIAGDHAQARLIAIGGLPIGAFVEIRRTASFHDLRRPKPVEIRQDDFSDLHNRAKRISKTFFPYVHSDLRYW